MKVRSFSLFKDIYIELINAFHLLDCNANTDQEASFSTSSDIDTPVLSISSSSLPGNVIPPSIFQTPTAHSSSSPNYSSFDHDQSSLFLTLSSVSTNSGNYGGQISMPLISPLPSINFDSSVD